MSGTETKSIFFIETCLYLHYREPQNFNKDLQFIKRDTFDGL